MPLENPNELEDGKVILLGGLLAEIEAFRYESEGDYIDFAGVTNLLLTDNTTNFVYIDVANNIASTATGGFPETGGIPLAIVTTVGGQVTTNQDVRARIVGDSNSFFELDIGTSGSAKTVTWPLASRQRMVLNANVTITFVDPKGPCEMVLKTQQDITGSRTITWPSNVRFALNLPAVDTASKTWVIYRFAFDGTEYFLWSAESFLSV